MLNLKKVSCNDLQGRFNRTRMFVYVARTEPELLGSEYKYLPSHSFFTQNRKQKMQYEHHFPFSQKMDK